MDESTNLIDMLFEDEGQNNEEQEQSDGFSKVGWDDTEDDPTTYTDLFDGKMRAWYFEQLADGKKIVN